MPKATILVVDDEPAVLKTMGSILSLDYQVSVANSGVNALLAAALEPHPDLILLDVMMPELDGYETLSRLKEDKTTTDIPVIFVTGMESTEDEEQGLARGAVDYITKPIRPAILLARVRAHLALKRERDFLHDKNDYLETEVARRMQENQIIQNVSIRALAHLAEIRDDETGEHILHTQAYVELMATRLQGHPRFSEVLSDHYIRLLSKSAPLHDIGKVGIPDSILLKPGKLTKEEFEVMKTHAVLGARAIERAESDVDQPVEFFTLAKEIAHWHHEKWNGKGYPDGLAGDEIPISARLMALADVFDALISKRVYKAAMSREKARQIIEEGRGEHFDPDITNAFLAGFDEFVQIAQKHQARPSNEAEPSRAGDGRNRSKLNSDEII